LGGGDTIYCNEELIEKIRNGNKDAEVEIIENNKAIIYKIIKDYYYASLNHQDMEDVFQAGCLGLLKAVKNYDASLGNKFITYAYYLIRGEVQRIYEHHSRRELTISSINLRNREGVIMESSEEVIEYIRSDRKEGDDEWMHSSDVHNKILVQDLLKLVTPIQKKILEYRYFEDLSQQEIGCILEKSQVYVSREEKKARIRLLHLIMEKECIY